MTLKPRTSLAVSPSTRDRLKKKARYHETIEGVILKLLDLSDRIEKRRDNKGKFTKEAKK